MAKVNIYLTFDGNCESAFTFYKSVLGGEYCTGGFNRYKDMPKGECAVSETDSQKVLHVALKISNETMLCGCDVSEAWGMKLVEGNNFNICVTPDSQEEAKRIFEELSAGGQVIMPLKKQFWGSLNGMCIDKFGIRWMVDYYLG